MVFETASFFYVCGWLCSYTFPAVSERFPYSSQILHENSYEITLCNLNISADPSPAIWPLPEQITACFAKPAQMHYLL